METLNSSRPTARKAYALCLGSGCLALALSLLMAGVASATELAPEVLSRVWLEGGKQHASVTLNGDEIARFKSDDEDDDDAAEEAEDLAVKLQEIISDKKFDPNLLVPAKDEGQAVIKLDANNVLKFDPFAGQDKKPDDAGQESQAFMASTKVVNALRAAFGTAQLPAAASETNTKVASKLGMLGQSFSGAASWYGGRFHGRKCSDGSRYDQERMTAAHRSLPFGTKVLVTNRRTGNSCVVEVNDRGPFIDGRVIDLSKAAAKELNMISSGVAMVECTVLQ